MVGMFPLNLVVYPNETLNLHIFEPRYKQLVKDHLETKQLFGIPTYLEDKVKEYGTLIEIVEVVNTYEDGRMDIVTIGKEVFKIEKLQNPMEGKLYSGASIYHIPNIDNSEYSERLLLVENVKKLFELVDLKSNLSPDNMLISYGIAHSVGLSLAQEYHLLSLENEHQRIAFLNDHLSRTIPVVKEVERVKRYAKLNGHFKNIAPLDF